MTWRAKATAPATFSLKQAMSAMLSGDSTNGWLTDWMIWIPDQWFNTSDFCTAGPPPTPEQIDAIDVATAATARTNPLSWALFAATIIPKLQSIMNDRVYGAYCENYVPAPTGLGPCLPPNYATHDWNVVQMPIGATRLFVAGGYGGNVQQAFYSTTSDTSGIDWGSGLSWDTVAPDIYIHNPSNTVVKYIAVRVNSFRPTCYAVEGGAAVTLPHVPTATPRDSGVPETPFGKRTYASYQDLGDELDRQQAKLEQLLDGMRYVANALVAPTASAGSDTPVTDGEDLPVANAHGAVLTVTDIPPAVSEDFETPVRFLNLGHYTLKTDDGPLQAEPITHNPQVVMFPPMTKYISASVMHPAHVSVKLLYPTK